MNSEFAYDDFLSYSAKDKAVVRPLAEWLVANGLRVWFDEWELKPGDSIPTKIEEGLERPRVLVLSMTASPFGSNWAHLLTDPQPPTINPQPAFNPLNQAPRFIPLAPWPNPP